MRDWLFRLNVVNHLPLYLYQGISLTMFVISEWLPKSKGLGHSKGTKDYSCRITINISTEVVKCAHRKR